MTVSSTENRKEYAGNDVTTSFATSPVVFFAEGDLDVYVVVDATGVATLQTITTHYAVSGGDGSTGTVTMVTAPATGETLVIVRNLDITQATDFVQNDGSDAEIAEDTIDRLTMIAQQLDARIDRKLGLADSDTSGATMELPSAVDRAGRFLAFEDDATAAPVAVDGSDGTTGSLAVALAASGGSALVGTVQSGSTRSRTVSGRFMDTIHVTDYDGIEADGSTTDDFTELQAKLATLTKPVRLIFPAKHYVIGSVTNLDLPESSVIDAWGAYFECTHNGVAFDVNPDATANVPAASANDVKRKITWLGGQFVNTNATKTASAAIQALMMRNFVVQGARAGDSSGNGFYSFVKFNGLDTYRFIDCYTFDCVRDYWVPASIYSGAANVLNDVELRGCNLSVNTDSGNEAGVYMEDRVINFRMNGGSIAGTSTVAHARFVDGSGNASRTIAFNGVHFEQGLADIPSILFVDTNSQGFEGVSIDGECEFGGATARWCGVKLVRCKNVKIGATLFTDSSTRASYGVYVDANCRNVRIEQSSRFLGFRDDLTITGAVDNGSGLIRITSASHGLETGDRVWIRSVTGTTEANAMWLVTKVDANDVDLQSSTFSSAYVSGGTMRVLNSVVVDTTATRAQITLEPEVITSITPRVLSSYNDTASSDLTASINMSTEFAEFNSLSTPETQMWPRGYFVHLRAQDSGSAAAADGTCRVLLRSPTGPANQITAVHLYLAGVANDFVRSTSGFVPADTSGNIAILIDATGAGTMDIGIGISGFVQ